MADPDAPTDLRGAVDALLRDPDLARLDALEAPFDPLAVMGWAAKERAHTRLLAWLLDPRARSPDRAHGAGDRLFRALLGLCHDEGEAPAPHGVHDLRVWREERLGDGLGATARAPDVRCEWSDGEGAPWVMLLEDKLDAAEGDEQLADYLTWMRRHRPGCRRLLVYLTPDGRGPSSVGDAKELRVLRWGALCDALLRALPEGDSDALRFARTTLSAMIARFDASPEARALMTSLHRAHPVAVEAVGGAGADPSLRQRVSERFPAAAWRLRTFAPREPALTEAWAKRVRECFNSIGLQRHRMMLGQTRDALSWWFEGVTDRVGLHALLWPGHRLGSSHARGFVALHAPNLKYADAVRAREQTRGLDALPDATRAWLLGATPVLVPGEGWKWLRAGELLAVPRGIDDAQSAERFAHTLHAALAPHLDALGRAFAPSDLRLFSADLDLDHVLPVDVHDREALYAGARPDARHAVIVGAGVQSARLGALFAETYGGTGALSYDYDGPLSLGLKGRGRALAVVPLSSVETRDAARLRARFEGFDGDVVLFGDPTDAAREALGALLNGCAGAAPMEPTSTERALRWHGVSSTLRDLRGLGARWSLTPAGGAVIAATLEGGREDPVVLAWRAGTARVVLLGADVNPLRGAPERFGRWLRALLNTLDVVAAQRDVSAVVPSVTPAVPSVTPSAVMPRRALAPPVRKRATGQAVLPWGATPKLPRGSLAASVVQDLSDVIIVDTETTGLSSTARLVEIGALHVRAGAVVDRFQTLVDPEEPIPRMVIRVHGITDAMVKGAPPAGDAIRAWQRFAAGRPVLAHNASFDHRILAQECSRTGVSSAGLAFWCTKRFAKAAFPKAPSYGLGALAQWLRLPSPPAHRALADCATAHGLLAACRATVGDAELSMAHGPPKPL